MPAGRKIRPEKYAKNRQKRANVPIVDHFTRGWSPPKNPFSYLKAGGVTRVTRVTTPDRAQKPINNDNVLFSAFLRTPILEQLLYSLIYIYIYYIYIYNIEVSCSINSYECTKQQEYYFSHSVLCRGWSPWSPWSPLRLSDMKKGFSEVTTLWPFLQKGRSRAPKDQFSTIFSAKIKLAKPRSGALFFWAKKIAKK